MVTIDFQATKIWLIIIFIGVIASCHSPTMDHDSSLQCIDRLPYAIPSTKKDPGVSAAISVANILLQDTRTYRLVQDYPRKGDTEVSEYPDLIEVNLVNIYPPGKHGVAFVLKGTKCLFIDTSRVRKPFYALNYEEDYGEVNVYDQSEHPISVYLLSFILLHETGHIQLEKVQPTNSSVENICMRYFSAGDNAKDCTESKVIEFLADDFASELVRKAYIDERFENRSTAVDILSALIMYQMSGVAKRVHNKNAFREDPSEFWNKGFSHPYIELRVARALKIIDSDKFSFAEESMRERRLKEDQEMVIRSELDKLSDDDLRSILNDTEVNSSMHYHAFILLAHRPDVMNCSDFSNLLEPNTQAYRADEDSGYLNTLVDFLIDNECSDIEEELLSLFTIANSYMFRSSLVQAYGKFRIHESLGLLVDLVESKQSDPLGVLTRNAFRSIGQIGDASLKPLLEAEIHSAPSQTQDVILESLNKLKSAGRVTEN